MTTPILETDSARNLWVVFNEEDEQGLRPQPRLTLPQWADKYRVLSSMSSAIGGPWRTSRVEIARGPMMAVTESGVSIITVMSCTQVMKTALLENVIGYKAHLDPCPMLLTQPKDDSVRSFSKERLAPMTRATPVLKNLLGDENTRNSSDTLDYKEFPGGFLALASAGSPANLAMRAIRITLMDEIDKYETTKEGDPITLGEERTATFKWNHLRIRTCSPTWEETSRIYKSYLSSDQRRAYCACPHCGFEQTLEFFRHVEWEKASDGVHEPETAAIYCESCGAAWSEAERLAICTTEGGFKWKQTRPFVCCGERQEPMKQDCWEWDAKNQVGLACCKQCGERAVSNEHAGFHCSKLHSPFSSVVELANKWLDAKDDPETKQTFYNTALGLPFALKALKKVETHSLISRCEIYPAQVPKGVVILTAGVDVQAGGSANVGRLECEVVGFGLTPGSEESWSIEHKMFQGDPSQPQVWKELDEYLLGGFEYEGGGRMAIRGVCVDSGGHNTNEVYNFCRARMGRNFWAIKGANDSGGQWSPVWPIPKLEPGKFRQTGYRPVIIGVNAAKQTIYDRLKIVDAGPGYCHFPAGRTPAYFDQLTSETLILEKKGGVQARKWVLQRGRANEALDLRVYAFAALSGLYAVRKLNLENIAAHLESFRPNDGGDDPKPKAPTPAGRIAPRSRVRHSNFLS